MSRSAPRSVSALGARSPTRTPGCIPARGRLPEPFHGPVEQPLSGVSRRLPAWPHARGRAALATTSFLSRHHRGIGRESAPLLQPAATSPSHGRAALWAARTPNRAHGPPPVPGHHYVPRSGRRVARPAALIEPLRAFVLSADSPEDLHKGLSRPSIFTFVIALRARSGATPLPTECYLAISGLSPRGRPISAASAPGRKGAGLKYWTYGKKSALSLPKYSRFFNPPLLRPTWQKDL